MTIISGSPIIFLIPQPLVSKHIRKDALTMLDLTLNTPKKKSDLTKENMLAFVKTKSQEERTWFKKLMGEHKVRKINNLTKEEYDGYDIPKIRESFAVKYFPEISSKAKKENKQNKKIKSFEEELAEL